MESESPIPIPGEFWQVAESISDTLSLAVDLPQALLRALRALLDAVGRDGAALYLPRFCEHVTQDWTCWNAPDGWGIRATGSLATATGPHVGATGRSPVPEIARSVMADGVARSGEETLGLGAALPVSAAGRTYGALLVAGEPIASEQLPLWDVLLRPFARAAALHSAVSGANTTLYQDLVRSRNTLRAMFDNLPFGIYIIDADCNLVAVNLSRAARAGERPSALVGRKCYKSLFHRGSRCPGCRVAETFASGQNTNRLQRDRLDVDRFAEWEIDTFPILDDKEQVLQTILIEQDVTEKRDLEANLIQSEKLAAVGQLAAGVAHEINNPLTAIIANAQLLQRALPRDDIDLLDSVRLIEIAGTRASQVVRNLLGIARKETSDFEPANLNTSIQNALELVQHELAGRPIEVRVSLDEAMPLVIANQDQLQGVWINLVLNALDALDKEPGLISIGSRYQDHQFQVTVEDNGRGITREHLARIFEPFFTTKSPGRGTGLGLSLCERVIRQHGGAIRVESQPGQGAKFTVTLPGPGGLGEDDNGLTTDSAA